MPRPVVPALLGALAGGAAAGVLNLLVGLGATAAGVKLEGAVGGPGTPVEAIPFVAPLLSSVVPAIPAWIVWVVLDRTTKSPDRIFLVTAAVLALLSCFPPLTLEGASLSARLVLTFMHFPAAAGIALGLVRGALSPARTAAA